MAGKTTMNRWFEARTDGAGRHHYRVYCHIDLDAKNSSKPLLDIICGLDKPFRTTLTDRDYQRVQELGREYLSRNPRSIS